MHNEVISDAKKRILNLIDSESFFEIDALKGKGVIAGYGTISSRPVCIFSQDFSIMSGAITYENCEKICKIIDMAVNTGVPLIGFYDSMGAKIDEGVEVFAGLQKVLSKLSNASGVIPQIAIVSGVSAGIATFAVSFSDFVFMIENKSKLFISGAQAVTAVTGEQLDIESYAGAKNHFENTGSCSFMCKNDKACISKIKELLSFLPDNNLADSEIIEKDENNRVCEELLKENIDVFDVINSVCDENKFFEINSGFAKNIVTGFGRIGGRVAGIVANNAIELEGKLNIDGVDKASKFVKFCDSFNIPVVTFIDNDGFVVSVEEENKGLVKKSAKLLFAYADCTSPKVNVIFGKAFGGANLAMGTMADIVIAWNTAKISVVNPRGAVNVLYSEDIAEADSPVEFRQQKTEEYIENNAMAENASGFVDSVISPVETRQRIISALDMFSSKREIKAVKRHESIAF